MIPDPGNDIWIPADWPAPDHVYAGTTTRRGGVSTGNYSSFNLGDHVGDKQEHVEENRKRLQKYLELPDSPVWLEQVHGNRVQLNPQSGEKKYRADGVYCNKTGIVCCIMTADCLPILVCDSAGKEIAAIHAGWRGLSKNIIANTVSRFQVDHDSLMAWFGPAICQDCYEVGSNVLAGFTPDVCENEFLFKPGNPGHWFADLKAIARYQFEKLGITRFFGGDYCSACNGQNFFSYRRDGNTGRNASMIWMAIRD